jgi:N6-adenosine-specific RNA methylase IME4
MTFDCNVDAPRSPSFAPAPCSAFRCIVSDPPWEYPEGFNSQPHAHDGPITHDKPLPYPSMTVEEICALQVSALAAKDCRLWLWTTGRYLPYAFTVMKAWGFRYRQTLVWHKLDGNMGGGVAPNSAEFLLVGVKGNPPIKSKLKQSVFAFAKSAKHSRKPKEWLWLIEQVDDGPRLEMFARRKRPGWHVWGNELANDVELPPNKHSTET